MALLALILFDYRSYWPMPSIPATVPEAVSALAGRADIRAVFDIPWNDRLHAKTGLYLQAYHQQPILAGQFIRDTPVNPARLAVLQATLDPALLDLAGVDVVIWHKGGPVDVGAGQRAREQLGAPIYEDTTLAIFDVPPIVAAATPQFAAVLPPVAAISATAAAYFYVPQPGWVFISGQLRGDNRMVELRLDDTPFQRWLVSDETPFYVALPITAAGFYTARWQLDPPCPQFAHPALTCRGVTVDGLTMTFTPSPFAAPVDFAGGIHLASAYVAANARPGELLPTGLWWQFDRPDQIPFATLSRFVHLLDASGNAVAQADGPLNQNGRFSQWAEWPEIRLPANLPPGEYTIVAGWYTFPSLDRLAVLSNAPEAVNGLIRIGVVTVVQP